MDKYEIDMDEAELLVMNTYELYKMAVNAGVYDEETGDYDEQEMADFIREHKDDIRASVPKNMGKVVFTF